MGGCLMPLIEMSSIEWSAAEEPLPGQKQSGDRYVVKSLPAGALLAVVDGIGHGKDAAHTAELGVCALNNSDARSPISLLPCCPPQLQGTRGAVLRMGMFSLSHHTLTVPWGRK